MAKKRKKLNNLPPVGDGPTPETAAKLRPDILILLHSRSNMPRELVAAGVEVREVYHAVVSSLLSRAITMEPSYAPPGKRVFRQPIELMAKGTQAAYDDRYRPWANRMAKHAAPGVSALSVVIDVVVEGKTLAEMDYLLNSRKGTTKRILIDALTEYAEMAGWVKMRVC